VHGLERGVARLVAEDVAGAVDARGDAAFGVVAGDRGVLGADTSLELAPVDEVEHGLAAEPAGMRNLPTTVVSTTLEGPLNWPDATLVSGDAVDVVARLKEESEVPLRSHGSLSMNRALMAAGLVNHRPTLH